MTKYIARVQGVEIMILVLICLPSWVLHYLPNFALNVQIRRYICSHTVSQKKVTNRSQTSAYKYRATHTNRDWAMECE